MVQYAVSRGVERSSLGGQVRLDLGLNLDLRSSYGQPRLGSRGQGGSSLCKPGGPPCTAAGSSAPVCRHECVCARVARRADPSVGHPSLPKHQLPTDHTNTPMPKTYTRRGPSRASRSAGRRNHSDTQRAASPKRYVPLVQRVIFIHTRLYGR